MKLNVIESSVKQGVLYAQLPTCIGYFGHKTLAKIKAGETYDFMIVGYSNKPNEKTGLPSTVFLDLVEPTDVLITESVLERAGSEGATGKNSGIISTYNVDLGEVYAGRNTPVPIVDNYNTGELPDYPIPEISMYVRKINYTHYAIGVDRYEDIAPCFNRRPEIARVTDFRNQVIELRSRYEKLDATSTPPQPLAVAKKALYEKFGFTLKRIRSGMTPVFKTL